MFVYNLNVFKIQKCKGMLKEFFYVCTLFPISNAQWSSKNIASTNQISIYLSSTKFVKCFQIC